MTLSARPRHTHVTISPAGSETVTEDEAEPTIQFYVPPEQEEGAYAHLFAVWHTAYDFTIDFAVTQPPRPAGLDDDGVGTIAPARVVSRVRVPPGLVFDLIRAINANMSSYEAEWGEIAPPERRAKENDDE